MTKEAFEREILARLTAHARRCPELRGEDTVKFVFQAMLGVGHLLASRDAVTAYAAREAAGLTPDPEEPMFEALSPAWCRLNLRRAMAEGLSPEEIAGLMLASESGMAFTRMDVLRFCRALAEAGTLPVPGETELAALSDETWLPAHSPAYRARYRPAYRVISVVWTACGEALAAMARKRAEIPRLLVTLDGPCASGKTTLARRLAAVFRADLVHTDDFVVPHARKTPERLAIPGGNCDAERLTREVLIPWKQIGEARVRRYDCGADRMCPEEPLAPAAVLILEGSYCNVPAIRALADVRLFLDTPARVREARLRARESAASLQRFRDRWIPLEEAYFGAYGLPDAGCVVIRGGGELPDGTL